MLHHAGAASERSHESECSDLSGRRPDPRHTVDSKEAKVDCPRLLAYTFVYGKRREVTMQRTAKVFMNNRSQAVRLPKEFQFATSEVSRAEQRGLVVRRQNLQR
jgi:hypothetical protein